MSAKTDHRTMLEQMERLARVNPEELARYVIAVGSHSPRFYTADATDITGEGRFPHWEVAVELEDLADISEGRERTHGYSYIPEEMAREIRERSIAWVNRS